MNRYFPARSLAVDGDPIRLGPEQAGWAYCGLHVISLTPGESRLIDLGNSEGSVVPLSGSFIVELEGQTFQLMGRASVFNEITDLCYVPVGSRMKIFSPGGGECAVGTAVATEHRPAFYRPAEDVSIELRGAGHMSRQVNGLLPHVTSGPDRLILVEVLTPAGNWSTYPPHKHDEHTQTEVALEEIYYFRMSRDEGFGMFRSYTSDRSLDDSLTVRHGDLYLVQRGFHGPSAAAPGYDMYFLNVMAGSDPERRWRFTTDPEHERVLDSWRDEPIDGRLPMAGL